MATVFAYLYDPFFTPFLYCHSSFSHILKKDRVLVPAKILSLGLVLFHGIRDTELLC